MYKKLNTDVEKYKHLYSKISTRMQKNINPYVEKYKH